MDVAFSTPDQQTYTAVEFSHLPAARLEELRTQLICTECRNPAFFRKRTRDGRAPCFGGRPHRDNCPQATAGAGAWGAQGSDDQDERINIGDRIVLDLRLEGGLTEDSPGGDPAQRRPGRGRSYGGNGTQQALMYRRLRTILRNLIRSESFRQSSQIIEVTNLVTSKASDFFVHFDDVKHQHLGKFLGLWGTLSDARLSAETIWLNTGGPIMPSIPVDESNETTLLGLARATELEDLAGAYVLVLGKVEQSGTWKKYVSFRDLTYISIILHD